MRETRTKNKDRVVDTSFPYNMVSQTYGFQALNVVLVVVTP